MLMIPFLVNNIPLRAFLVGMTQSNMSIPRAMHSRIFAGVPTPIRYLGLSAGRILQTCSVISYIIAGGSPTDNPPMAFPSQFCEAIYSAEIFLRSLYTLPCTIGKNDWLY